MINHKTFRYGQLLQKRDFSGPSSVVLRRSRGFSLVEVTLALALLSFALLSLVGLFSVGLTQSRQNIDRSTEMQIMDWVHNKVDAAYESTNLSSLNGHIEGFDNSGIAGAPNISSSIYSATMTVSATNPLPGSAESLWMIKVVIATPSRGNQILATNSFWLSKK